MGNEKNHLYSQADVRFDGKYKDKVNTQQQFSRLSNSSDNSIIDIANRSQNPALQDLTQPRIGDPYNDTFGTIGLVTQVIFFDVYGSEYSFFEVNGDVDFGFSEIPQGRFVEFTLDIVVNTGGPSVTLNFLQVLTPPVLDGNDGDHYILKFVGANRADDDGVDPLGSQTFEYIGGTFTSGGGAGFTDPLTQLLLTVTPVTLPSTTEIDADTATEFQITLDRNIEFDFSGGPASGRDQVLTIFILQNGTGGFTIDWGLQVTNPPSIGLAPNEPTTVVLVSRNQGTSWTVESAAAGGAGGEFFGPWTADHDAGGFNLFNSTGVFFDASLFTGILFNAGGVGLIAPTGDTIDFFINDLVIPKFGITETSIESNVPLEMNANKITGVLNPTDPNDVVTRDYYLTNGIWLELDGTTIMSGDIDVGNFAVKNAGDVRLVRDDGVGRMNIIGGVGSSTQVLFDAATDIDIRFTEALADVFEIQNSTNTIRFHRDANFENDGSIVDLNNINLVRDDGTARLAIIGGLTTSTQILFDAVTGIDIRFTEGLADRFEIRNSDNTLQGHVELQMNANKITGLLNPTNPQDAVTLDHYLNANIFLDLDGSTAMTGNLDMGNNSVVNSNDFNLVRDDGVGRMNIIGGVGSSTQVLFDAATDIDIRFTEALADVFELRNSDNTIRVFRPFHMAANDLIFDSAGGDIILVTGFNNSKIFFDGVAGVGGDTYFTGSDSTGRINVFNDNNNITAFDPNGITIFQDGYLTIDERITDPTPLTNAGIYFVKVIGGNAEPWFVGDGTAATSLLGGGGGASPLTTKGDLFGFDTADARIPVGTNGQVLTANSAVALGVEWAAAAAGSQTPWLTNIDGDGFFLQDVGGVEFRDNVTLPASSVNFIAKDVVNLVSNVISGDGHLWRIGGTQKFGIGSTTSNFFTVLDMNSNKITDLADPTVAQDAATKAYVDSQTTLDGIQEAEVWIDSNTTDQFNFEVYISNSKQGRDGITDNFSNFGDDTVFFVPIYLGRRARLIEMGYHLSIFGVAPVANYTVQMGLYSNRTDGQNYPETQLDDDSVTQNTALGAHTVFMNSTDLEPGLYWIAIHWTSPATLPLGVYTPSEANSVGHFINTDLTPNVFQPILGYIDTNETSLPTLVEDEMPAITLQVPALFARFEFNPN